MKGEEGYVWDIDEYVGLEGRGLAGFCFSIGRGS